MKLLRIVLFATSVVGPFIKVRILGTVAGSDVQLLYVSYYFAVQFFTPLVDFGASWSSIRTHLENKEDFVLFFTPLGILIGVAVCAFFIEYGLVILIATAMAFFNYHLQVFRLQGETVTFYIFKISRLVLDIAFLFALLKVTQNSEETILKYVLSGELFAILIILVVIRWKNPSDIFYKFQLVFFANAKDFSFLILKIIRANFLRLISPFLFGNLQFVKFFYLLLLYELIVQFANAEYLRRIVDKGVNFKYIFLACAASVPLQFLTLKVFSLFMEWEFTLFEYVCVIIIGSISVYSVFSFRLIAVGAYSKFRDLVLLDIAAKVSIFTGLYVYDATYNQVLAGFLLNYTIWFGVFFTIHRRAEADVTAPLLPR